MTPVLGLVVNPVAGIGGTAGLKGSDGESVQAAAAARGAHPRAVGRATRALATVSAARPGTRILTAAGEMGEDAVLAAGLEPVVVYTPALARTTGADTTAAAAALVRAGAGIVLFAGGDGTARDVSAAVVDGALADAALNDGAGRREPTPILGIPAGVKMYSGCFAVSPTAAGAIALRWLEEGRLARARMGLQEREVLDVDEEQVRSGRVDPTLHALVLVPVLPGRTQARKSATLASESGVVHAAVLGLVARLEPGVTYLLGPGGTLREVATVLGVASTPLGVDVVRDGELLLADASERQLLELLHPHPADSAVSASVRAKVIVTVIGGQGFLLGRGNQQLSSAVLRLLGEDPLVVVATEEKLVGLRGRPLLIDTGDPELDSRLAGYVEVVTGIRSRSLYPVNAPEHEGAA